MERIYALIVHKPQLLLFLLALLTCFFAYHTRAIQVDSSVESLLPKDDPDRAYYEEVRQLFGSDEIGVIGVITDTIYTPQVLQKIKRLAEEIEDIPEVKNVASLMNVKDVIASIVGDYTLLVPEIPTTAAAWQELKHKIAASPIYLKHLVSADGRAAAINIVFFDSISDEEFLRRGVDEKIQAIVDRENGPEQLYYTGLPHFKVYSAQAMWGDVTRFVPLTLGCIVVTLFLSFHSLRGVLLPALTVIVSLIWTLGIMVLAGSRLSLGSIALPPLLLVLGTAYSLHVVAEYYELARPGRSASEVVMATLQKTGFPLFITALTTMLGFLSLIVSPIVSIQEMGIYSSIGILIAFVLSGSLIPALLAVLRLPAKQETAFSPTLSAALQRLGRIDMRYRRSIIGIGFLVAGLAVWQTFSIRADANFQAFFRKDDPIRQATDAINRHLVGSMAFYVVVDGDETDIIKKWDTLRRLKDFQLSIDALPGVEKTLSFVDYCEILDTGLQAVPPEEGTTDGPQVKTTFWENPAQLSGVMRLVFFNADTISSVVNHPSYSRTNILVRTSLSRSSDIMALVEKIQAIAKQTFPPELKVQATGKLVLLTNTTGDIVTGQIQSLSLAAGVIFVIMAATFLSIRVGLIAMVPNIFPIVVFFGLMGVSGATLNLGTSIIASIALGIAVDNTIHLMARLSAEVRTVSNQEQALLRTLSTVGKPVLYTSLILFLGFLILYLSTFVPTQEFGLLSAVTIVVALIGDVVLLPALLSTTQVITVWDLLYVKLGKDPHRTIGIFESLRPAQAKIVALMSELRAFPQGQAILRRGELGNEMYVIIKGSAGVWVQATGHRRLVRQLERGEEFGEMGLIRHHERTADVIANEEVEVMVLDEGLLTRLQRRHPRIAVKIFLNIARILTDRLEAEQSHGVARPS